MERLRLSDVFCQAEVVSSWAKTMKKQNNIPTRR
jgi:hypothetical protein